MGILGKEPGFYNVYTCTTTPHGFDINDHYQKMRFKKWELVGKEMIFLSCRQLADLHKENASKDSAVQVSQFLNLSNNI